MIQLINLNPVKDIIREKLIEKYNSTTFMNTSKINISIDIADVLDSYIETKQIKEPTIYITPNAYLKMRKLVDATSSEIGWYGTVSEYPGLERVYLIDDIIVYPQTVTGATCEQDESKMFDFEMSLTTEQVNKKRFQGHSHVNMGVTPSGVDEAFYQDLLTQVTDYFIIAITNKRNEYTVRFYDIQNNILYSNIPILLLLEDGSDLNLWYTEVIRNLQDRKIELPKPTESKFKFASDYYRHEESANPYDLYYDPTLGYVTEEEIKMFKPKAEKQNKKNKRGR